MGAKLARLEEKVRKLDEENGRRFNLIHHQLNNATLNDRDLSKEWIHLVVIYLALKLEDSNIL